VKVVLNADDFGCTSAINAAVLRAHRHGVLTSASLVVAGDAAEEAVALARATPTLAVGLHVVLTEGRPSSPPGEVSHLLSRTGCFPADPAWVWIQYIFSQRARAEMARELRAQFVSYAATGLALTHVNGHQHLHMHPAVFRALLPLAQEHGARGLRLPRDDFRLAMAYDRRGAGAKAVWSLVFGILSRRYAHTVQALNRASAQPHGPHRMVVADRVFGLLQSGAMEEPYVVRVLQSVEAPVTELYFHPTSASEAVPLGPNPGDLAALLSPAVRRIITERRLELASYATLEEVS
jgi:hopanoid biosynthesis associated protein HpnK